MEVGFEFLLPATSERVRIALASSLDSWGAPMYYRLLLFCVSFLLLSSYSRAAEGIVKEVSDTKIVVHFGNRAVTYNLLRVKVLAPDKPMGKVMISILDPWFEVGEKVDVVQNSVGQTLVRKSEPAKPRPKPAEARVLATPGAGVGASAYDGFIEPWGTRFRTEWAREVEAVKKAMKEDEGRMNASTVLRERVKYQRLVNQYGERLKRLEKNDPPFILGLTEPLEVANLKLDARGRPDLIDVRVNQVIDGQNMLVGIEDARRGAGRYQTLIMLSCPTVGVVDGKIWKGKEWKEATGGDMVMVTGTTTYRRLEEEQTPSLPSKFSVLRPSGRNDPDEYKAWVRRAQRHPAWRRPTPYGLTGGRAGPAE